MDNPNIKEAFMWFQLTFALGTTTRAHTKQELWNCSAEGLVERIDICRRADDTPGSPGWPRDHIVEASLRGLDVCEQFIGLICVLA